MKSIRGSCESRTQRGQKEIRAERNKPLDRRARIIECTDGLYTAESRLCGQCRCFHRIGLTRLTELGMVEPLHL